MTRRDQDARGGGPGAGGAPRTTRRELFGQTLAQALAPAFGAAALGSCIPARAARETAPGILVVAVDGLRADHLGAYGYDRETTPNLDALASQGVLFESVFSSAPRMLPAHVSLLTGCQPWVARRTLPSELEVSFERRWKLPIEVPHLAVELLAAGWSTAAFVDHEEMAPLYGLDRGFKLFVDSGKEERPGLAGLDRRIQQWVRGLDRERPFFGYVHLHDLERSWVEPDREWERYFYPPRPELSAVPPVGLTDEVLFSVPYSRGRSGVASLGSYETAYDGHLRRLDGQLQALLEGLEVNGRLEETTVVVVGSFGLQFGEAGLYLRAGRYSVADLHVPLIVRPRAGLLRESARGGRAAGIFSLPDLVPTLLELEGVPLPWGLHGISQAGALEGGTGAREIAFASCGIQEGCALFGPRFVLEYLLPGDVSDPALRRSWFGEEQVEETPPVARFYDWRDVPHPPLTGGLRAGDAPTFERYRVRAAEWIQTMEEVRRALHGRGVFGSRVDDATVERLREQGYLPR